MTIFDEQAFQAGFKAFKLAQLEDWDEEGCCDKFAEALEASLRERGMLKDAHLADPAENGHWTAYSWWVPHTPCVIIKLTSEG